MKKQLISIILALALVIIPAHAAQLSFSDVDDTAYYSAAVSEMAASKVINGYPDGTFKPDNTLTRAEAAIIICRLNGSFDLAVAETIYNDVKATHDWASGYIAEATRLGIIDGMGGGRYMPGGTLTEEQFIKMLVCWLGFDADAKNAGGWPKGYITVADRFNMLYGFGSTDYSGEISRADACLLANNARILKTELSRDTQTPPELLGYNTIPAEIPQGKAYYIVGTIISKSPIKKVTVNIFSSTDNAQALNVHETVYPNTYSYDLSVIDKKLYFDMYPMGDMEIQIIAENASGEHQLEVGKFKIVNKAVPVLDNLRTLLPAGTYWNHNGVSYDKYKEDRDGYNLKSTIIPCNHKEYYDPLKNSGGSHCEFMGNYSGQCGCNSYKNSTQCMAFARFIGDKIYGAAPNGSATEGNGWVQTKISKLKPGDYIRYRTSSKHYGHSVIVYKSDESSVTVVECNQDSQCGIDWRRTITREELKSYYSVKCLRYDE